MGLGGVKGQEIIIYLNMEHLDTIILLLGLAVSVYFNVKQSRRAKKRDLIDEQERKGAKEKKLKFHLVQQGNDPIRDQSHVELYFRVEIFNISKNPIYLLKGKVVFFEKGFPTNDRIFLLKENATFLGKQVYPGDPVINTMYIELENKSIIKTATKNPFRIIIVDEFENTISSEDFYISFSD